MTGLLLVADPPNEEHLRVHFRLRGCPISDVWFWDRRGLGSMYYLREAAFRARFSARLGPDALAVSLSQLRRQFGSCDREIKVALLDQARLAGVGNLYASEILHRAGIHPQVRCTDLSDAAWRRLHRALRSVLLAAIRYEGSTLADGTYRNALNRDGSYQNCHRVYQKTGQPCARCHRGTIQRTVQAQRSTFFCPVCQYK